MVGWQVLSRPSAAEGGGRRTAFTGLATQPYSATEVDGWQHELSRVCQNRAAVPAALDERGIGYLHLRGLGTPKEGRLAARAGQIETLLRIYDAHLATTQAREELDELTELVRSGRRVCLLCYERDPDHCHRKRIAALLHERIGVAVEHLFAAPFIDAAAR